ncbi:uncharacterized protein [Watersipora subatra]|uniref:uncharacterized protein n=1 Tax=Watersipora subatra TaxID=2589382 RepID=UPI00355C43A9
MGSSVIKTQAINFEAYETPQKSRHTEHIKLCVKEHGTTPPLQQQELNDSITQLAQNIAMGIRKTKKTEIEPSIFTGNPIEFDDWVCDFDSYLDSMGVENGEEKIRYLKKYVDGPAKEAINRLFLVRTDRSYNEAREKLRSRFGNKLNIARHMRQKLDNWPRILSGDVRGLQKYADYLENCRSSMSSVSGLKILEDPQVNEKLSAVLPDWERRKWASKVYKIQKSTDRYPRFEEFTYFLNEVAKMQAIPLLQNQCPRQGDTTTNKNEANQHTNRRQNQQHSLVKSFATNHAQQNKPVCLFCKKDHQASECFQLSELPYEKRIKFIENNMLCYRCVKPGHGSSSCPNTMKLKCKKCHKSGHSTALHKRREDWDEEFKQNTRNQTRQPMHTQQKTHDYQAKIESKEQLPSQTTLTQTNDASTSKEQQVSCNRNTMLSSKKTLFNMGMPVYVSTAEDPTNEVLVYAFFDSASDHSYITSDLATKIKLKTIKTESLNMETMAGRTKNEVREFGNLIIKRFFSGEARLESAYEWPSIPNSTGEFANTLNVRDYTHLATLANSLPPPMDIPIGLLVGANCSTVHYPLEGIKGEDHQPFAVRTKLGWMVFGVEAKQHMQVSCYRTSVEEDAEKEMMSEDDIKFLDVMLNQTTVTKVGSYQMPLPSKSRPILPDDFRQAQRQQEALVRHFEKEPSIGAEAIVQELNEELGGVKPSRIVWTSSRIVSKDKFSIDDIQHESGIDPYTSSKYLIDALFISMNDKLRDKNITATTTCLALMRSGLSLGILSWWIWFLLAPISLMRLFIQAFTWEQQIRSIRAALEGQLSRHSARLTSTRLRIAFYEAMNIGNSRPISVEALNDHGVQVITLNHLLTSKPAHCTPLPEKFDSTEVFGQKMWRKTQQMADEFWTAWKDSYLQQITKRQRWERPQENLRAGDIVLVKEENTPRYEWPTGKVIEVTQGEDGKVRRVRVQMAASILHLKGSVLERPIQKLILLLKAE